MNLLFRFKKSTTDGFTLVETMVVIAITIIITAMVLFSFSNYSSTDALVKDQAKVVSALEKARNLTLNSNEASQYGVHFATSAVTVFKGTVYNSSDSNNIVVSLTTKVEVSSTTFAGGGSDVIFSRLTGETSQTGTTTLSLITASTTKKTITIYGTGLIQAN